MMRSLAFDTLRSLLFLCLLSYYHPRTKADVNKVFSCDAALNYTTGSIYEQNLNLTLTSIAANASLSGFFFTSEGENPDVVYGLIQCRDDISKEDCQLCADTASTEIQQVCPYKKEAYLGYDSCWLRYADWRFYSSASSSPTLAILNVENATDPDVFTLQVRNLVRNISSDAASSPSRFAVGSTAHTDFVNINALVQCTRDLTENSCSGCLDDIISFIPNCCNGKEGGQVFSPSCYLRFEIYSFFSPSLLERDSAPGATRNSTNPPDKKSTSKFIALAVIPVGAALVVLPMIYCFFSWRKAKGKGVGDVREDSDKNMESLSIGLKTLKTATRDFSDSKKLGEGGFGPVYKGTLPDGQQVAVKRLSSSSGQGLQELKTEVMLVAKLLHRNLVKLLGFCIEEKEKLLVYEYLPKGSLDRILFDKSKRFTLKWEMRYKIIVGITRGLLYLHEDSQLRIIHRDLKASNILLDEFMNPKISDFGLARLFGENQTQAKTNRIAGTCGYMAPEYAKNGHFSTKSDVYSFGILVLEILTGRKSSSFFNSINLQSHAWQHWSNGTALELLDPTMGDQWPRQEALKCIHIGLMCVQEAAVDRPTVSQVIMMLSSYTLTSPAPSKPAFFVSSASFGPDPGWESSSATQVENSGSVSLQQSVNEVTISELDPR